MSDLELMRLLNAAFRAEGRLNHQGPEAGTLPPRHKGHGRILATLRNQGELTQRELADRLDIRPQSLTTALLNLEKAGLIRRRTNESDRRETLVQVTPEGVARCGEIEAIRGRTAETMLADLTPEEKETLAGLLRRIVQAAET